MHEAAREDEQLVLLHGGGEQRVVVGVGAHEPDVQLALHHQQELGRAGVGVRGVEAALGEVDACSAEAQGVEAVELPHEGGGDDGLGGLGVGVGGGLDEFVGPEVRGHDLVGGLAGEAIHDDVGGGIRDAEVLEWVGVGGGGQHGHQADGEHKRHHGPHAAAVHDAHIAVTLQVRSRNGAKFW